MKHKLLAQLSLVICLVAGCSGAQVEVQRNEQNLNALSHDNVEKTPLSKKAMPDVAQSHIVFTLATNEQRTAFLNAEQFLLQHDDAAFFTLLPQLKDYPLYPYLQAQWLKKNLENDLVDSSEIENFLNAHKDSRDADELRKDWLTWLGKNQQWAKFNQYYQAETDSKKADLQCQAAWAQYVAGQQTQAFNATQELWLKGVSHSACNDAFAVFNQAPQFNDELVWQRLSALLQAKKPNLQSAAQLKQYLAPTEQQTVDEWLKLHQHPALVSNPNKWDTQNPKAGDIFAHAIARLANNNFETALTIWEAQKNNYAISQAAIDEVVQKFGMLFANADYNEYAYSYLIQANHLDENARHTLVRAALKQQNWSQVDQALTKLTVEEKAQDKWQYWQGRAWMEMGKTKQAREIFTTLAKKADFYALLSANQLNQPYQAQHVPVPVTEQDLKALQQHQGFQAAAEWFVLGRKDEALKQWWYSVKKSSPQQIMTAAKLAQILQQPKLAAFTLAKAEYWQDLDLRFPIAFEQEINNYALQQGLDPALVFGLIRQESVFDEYAGSSVGARGLMQIMPSTGRLIAKQLQEPWSSDQVLYEPETNIRYGTFYFRQLLDKFSGQAALAAAGYNAGPGRVKQWLPNTAMPMDVWIETIPFNETRQYVGMVIANTFFYQQRLHRDVLKVSDFMSDVQPAAITLGQLSK